MTESAGRVGEPRASAGRLGGRRRRRVLAQQLLQVGCRWAAPVAPKCAAAAQHVERSEASVVE